ncbi:MAG: RNA polymerase sigma factor [Sneathiella sp.]
MWHSTAASLAEDPVKAVSDKKNTDTALEEKAFWIAWNTHREYLRRLSLVWMNISASDAEDALSDATIRAFEKYADNASQITNERAWFARLLHNICIDIHRSNKRRSKLSDKVKEIVTIDTSAVETVELTPEAELLNTELGRSLIVAINDLPEKMQQPLVMRLVKGESYDDIGEALGITNDNARKRVQQARAALRRKLAHLRE